MDYENAFAISAAGMTLERTRLEVAALNLANANAVAAPGAETYRPMRVVARALASDSSAAQPFAQMLANGLSDARAEPQAAMRAGMAVSIEPVLAPQRLVHEPGHPSADARGFVAYPGVDPATEMVTLMGAMRSYEANVAAMNTARSMALKALEIGGRP